jgi:hypothetical protein
VIHPFDIFKAETGGSVLWLESTATLEAAKARVKELAGSAPGGYFIVNQETGNRIYMKPESAGGQAADWEPGGERAHDER